MLYVAWIELEVEGVSPNKFRTTGPNNTFRVNLSMQSPQAGLMGTRQRVFHMAQLISLYF
jgi:hypothetical protein